MLSKSILVEKNIDGLATIVYSVSSRIQVLVDETWIVIEPSHLPKFSSAKDLCYTVILLYVYVGTVTNVNTYTYTALYILT